MTKSKSPRADVTKASACEAAPGSCVATNIEPEPAAASGRAGEHVEPVAVFKVRPKPEPKRSVVLAMLQRAGGVDIGALMAATGWQAHTARAMLSNLRKQGHTIVREVVDCVSYYRVVAETGA